MGAGATMSLGKKARELTNTSVNKKIAKIISGAMYWRKNGTVVIVVNNDYIIYDLERFAY